MSHMLTETDEMFSASGKAPWHQLGTIVQDAPNSAAAIKLAGLGWSVDQMELQAITEAEEPLKVPGFRANVRSDTKMVLGVVTPTYTPCQNVDAFSFVDKLIKEEEVFFETAGSLKGGRVVWLLARLPGAFTVGKEDRNFPYLLFMNSHDGSTAIRIMPTTVRVVCWNTLNLALGSDSQRFCIRHVGDVQAKVDRARHAIGLAHKQFETFEEQVVQLVDVKLVMPQVTGFVEQLIPMADNVTVRAANSITRRRDRIAQIWETDPHCRLEGIEDSAWALVNAYTQFIDHERNCVGETEDEKLSSRIAGNWLGHQAIDKQDCFTRAIKAFV